MAITFLLEGCQPARVTIGTSPIAELMACLHVLTEPEHHPHQQRWAHATTSTLPPALAASLRRFAPLWARYRCRLLLPIRRPLDRTLEEELGILADLDIDVFAEHVANALVGVQHGAFDRILGNPTQQELVLDTARRRSYQREELAERLFADASTLRTDLLDVLDACREPFFDEFWKRAQIRLHDASSQLRGRFEREPLPAFFASLGPASRLEHSPNRVIYDKLQQAIVNLAVRDCLIIPSLQSFPHLMIKADSPRWPVAIHTPVAADDNQAPSLADMRNRLTVLTDPQRLSLCRHLAGEAITTSDLARRTGMPVSQVSRHIGRLREAGLITSTRDGRLVHHRLSSDTMNRLGIDLLSAILR
jgi:DNA-binding transcriptional ArsR family regulator